MSTLLASLLLTAIAGAAPRSADQPRSRPPKPPVDEVTPHKHRPIVNEAGATALERRRRDIEIVVVGDVEDGAPGGVNVIELGQVSYRPETNRAAGRSQGVTILRRVVTVRIGTERSGFAPLRAHLQADDRRCRVRVDGKTLTMLPQVIDPLAPLGQAVAHLLEIEIATTTAEGPVAASISWTSDPP